MQRDFALRVIHIYRSALGVSSTASSASTQRTRLEAQPLPTRGADPGPSCNAGASRERPNLPFIVLFCSTLMFHFPFTASFSISSLLYSPNVPRSDSSGISALANSSLCKSLKSPRSAGGLSSRASRLKAIWGGFSCMCLRWLLLQFDLLLHAKMFSALSGSSATWKRLRLCRYLETLGFATAAVVP